MEAIVKLAGELIKIKQHINSYKRDNGIVFSEVPNLDKTPSPVNKLLPDSGFQDATSPLDKSHYNFETSPPKMIELRSDSFTQHDPASPALSDLKVEDSGSRRKWSKVENSPNKIALLENLCSLGAAVVSYESSESSSDSATEAEKDPQRVRKPKRVSSNASKRLFEGTSTATNESTGLAVGVTQLEDSRLEIDHLEPNVGLLTPSYSEPKPSGSTWSLDPQ